MKRPRSKFWVVTTHVLTTGFAFPALAGMAAPLLTPYIVPESPESGMTAFFIMLGFLTAGYLGGTLYSLSYLRKVAVIDRPTACTLPSVIVFTFLVLLGLARYAYALRFEPRHVIALCIYCVVIVVGFSFLTARGFRTMEEPVKNHAADEDASAGQ